jgi:hypothetical protein
LLIEGGTSEKCEASPAEHKAGFDLAVVRGWLTLDRSSTFVKFTVTGVELFA